MNNGTFQVDEGAQGARHRQLSEKFSLLLESRRLTDEELGSWLRENVLHSQQAREELRDAKKQIKKQQRELDRKEKAPAESAAVVTLQKTKLLFRDHQDD